MEKKIGLDLVKKVAKSEEEITTENVKKWFNRLSKEKKKRLVVDEKVLDLIKQSIDEPEFAGERFIDTLITYQSVLESNSTYGISDYIKAVRFVAFLESNEGNATDAYIKAFSYTDFVKSRIGFPADSPEMTNISSAASRYRKSKLVVAIMSQAEVPLYIMFQGYRYKAISRLAKEMEEANYPRDRINAADKLLTHLKPPEGLKIEVDVNTAKEDVIDTYEEAMKNMVKKQRELMIAGGDVKEITNVKILDAEIVN